MHWLNVQISSLRLESYNVRAVPRLNDMYNVCALVLSGCDELSLVDYTLMLLIIADNVSMVKFSRPHDIISNTCCEIAQAQ